MKIVISIIIFFLLFISCEFNKPNKPNKKTSNRQIPEKQVVKDSINSEVNQFEGRILDEDSNNVSYKFPVLHYGIKYTFSDSINRFKYEDSTDHELKFKISRRFKIDHKTWPKSEQNFVKAKLYYGKSDRSKLRYHDLYPNIYEIIKVDIKTSNGYKSFFEFDNFFPSFWDYDDQQEFLIKIKPVQISYNKLKRNAIRIVLKSPPGEKINREHTFDYVLIDNDWKLVARTYIDRVDAFYGYHGEPELYKWNYNPPSDRIVWDYLELEF